MFIYKATPPLLALAACLSILLGVGPGSWPLLVGWLAAIILVATVWEAAPVVRVGMAIALIPLCILLTWEGGLFFVPSAAALVILAVVERRPRPATGRP